MERLTERVYEQVLIKGLEIFGIGEKNADILENATRKLFEYEDLGLSPEEIKDILAVLSESQDDVDDEGISIGLIHDLVELAEYRKAKGQGLLVKLPCKVGDTYFYVLEDEEGEERFKIYNDKVCSICIKDDGIYIIDSCENVERIGSDLALLTKEEADKRLAELEGGVE